MIDRRETTLSALCVNRLNPIATSPTDGTSIAFALEPPGMLHQASIAARDIAATSFFSEMLLTAGWSDPRLRCRMRTGRCHSPVFPVLRPSQRQHGRRSSSRRRREGQRVFLAPIDATVSVNRITPL